MCIRDRNILLVAINAKYSHTNLAVRDLQNMLAAEGMEAGIAEYTINQSTREILKMCIRDRAWKPLTAPSTQPMNQHEQDEDDAGKDQHEDQHIPRKLPYRPAERRAGWNGFCAFTATRPRTC